MSAKEQSNNTEIQAEKQNINNRAKTKSESPIIFSPIGKFHGGIHPPEFKTISNQTPIQHLKLPGKLYLPLQQHIGEAGIPLVKIGDKVNQAQLIASSQTLIASNLHTPLNGTIESIQSGVTGHPSQQPQPIITVNVDVNQPITSDEPAPNELWQNTSAEELRIKVRNAGIVGLGGATFPTHVKLSNPTISTLIVNAMECEPYITCDDRMLQELTEQVIEGAQIAATISGANEIIFATEDNKPKAISALEKVINSSSSSIKMKIMVAPTKYPSGGEKQLIELVLGRQLPHGQLPASIGVLVQNIATLYAVYEAVVLFKPLTKRLVTITGNQVPNPANYWIPFGTELTHIIKVLDISYDSDCEVIIGGPLMGKRISQLDTPVTKSTNCIIFNRATKPENKKRTTQQPCIRCSDCEKVCPVELLPQQLLWLSQSDQWEPVEKQGLFDCIECGACAYVCPSEIPLVDYYRYAKSSIRHNQQKQKKSEHAKARFEFREMRLQRAKAERAEKHKKAAEARRLAAKDKQQDPSGKKAAIAEALKRVKKKKTESLTNTNDSNDSSKDKT